MGGYPSGSSPAPSADLPGGGSGQSKIQACNLGKDALPLAKSLFPMGSSPSSSLCSSFVPDFLIFLP